MMTMQVPDRAPPLAFPKHPAPVTAVVLGMQQRAVMMMHLHNPSFVSPSRCVGVWGVGWRGKCMWEMFA